jgi:signal transduction histidine kinase
MRSIQYRLTLRLLVCVLAMSVAGSVAVYFVFRSSMIRQFDDGLRAEAHAISTLFLRDHDGRYEFQPPPNIASMFHHGNDADAYCIRRMDGTVVVKSRSLGKSECPGMDHPASYEGYHHVYEPGDPHRDSYWRAIFLTFVPASESRRPSDRFQIVVAAEQEEIGHLLKRLLAAMATVALIAGAATVLLVVWTVRRDLSPLRTLAQQAAGIGTSDLDTRFSLQEAPRELEPIHRALNGLLQRMQDALKREQRFNADVAHELRTPVSELRSLCEVAIAAANDPNTTAEALRDVRDIGVQMENIITSLLALRRNEGATLRPFDIVALAREAWQGVEPVAAGLTMSWQVPSEAVAVCDRTMMLAVLRNLFENAARYTHPGGEIACAVALREAETEIVVRNRPHDLVPEDVKHLFEPFWRKETARSDGAHVGLGLALADAYAHAFGGSLRAALSDDGWISFTLVIPRLAGP